MKTPPHARFFMFEGLARDWSDAAGQIGGPDQAAVDPSVGLKEQIRVAHLAGQARALLTCGEQLQALLASIRSASGPSGGVFEEAVAAAVATFSLAAPASTGGLCVLAFQRGRREDAELRVASLGPPLLVADALRIAAGRIEKLAAAPADPGFDA